MTKKKEPRHAARTRQHPGGEHRAQCPDCEWVGHFWFSKANAEHEGLAHRANPEPAVEPVAEHS